MSDHDPITANEAARILRCHISAVYRWGFAGRIQAWRVGSKWEFGRASVEAFRVGAAQPPPDLGPTQRQQQRHNREVQEEMKRRGYG